MWQLHKKSQILKRKSRKAKQFFVTPTASAISQICEIWRQKGPSGNHVVVDLVFGPQPN